MPMAGDWIKADHSLPDKPEVWRMAAILEISPEAVVGHLLRVWIWVDQQSETGNDLSVTTEHINSIARVTPKALPCNATFAQAMRNVGWLHGEDGALSFPNFDYHNGDSAKKRALTKKRVKRFRNARSVTREEKSITPLPPLKGGRVQRARKVKTGKAKGNGQVKGARVLTDLAIQALGIKYGVAARSGESHEAYRERILAEDRRRHGE